METNQSIITEEISDKSDTASEAGESLMSDVIVDDVIVELDHIELEITDTEDLKLKSERIKEIIEFYHNIKDQKVHKNFLKIITISTNKASDLKKLVDVIGGLVDNERKAHVANNFKNSKSTHENHEFNDFYNKNTKTKNKTI